MGARKEKTLVGWRQAAVNTEWADRERVEEGPKMAVIGEELQGKKSVR
jgi:hypothetical protein